MPQILIVTSTGNDQFFSRNGNHYRCEKKITRCFHSIAPLFKVIMFRPGDNCISARISLLLSRPPRPPGHDK